MAKSKKQSSTPPTSEAATSSDFTPPNGAVPPGTPTLRRRKPLVPQALPGLEQVRDPMMEEYCANISADRADQATLRASLADNERGALHRMMELKVRAYHASGVECVIVPGDDKLRVRTTKDTQSVGGEQ